MKPEDVHLAVIGTGPFGLEMAAWAKRRGYHLTVFERQGGIGGDWLRWGNPWSKLQSHRDGYLFSGPFHVPGEDQLPSYPSLPEMLDYFQVFADVAGITKHIKFKCTATGRSALQNDGRLQIFFVEDGGEEQSAEVTHIFAAPGRVNKRREVKFPGEKSFRGRIAWGSNQDLVDVVFANKQVVIIGHGSFAIENARHALEEGAASVTILSRRGQLVMSRAAGFFVDRNIHREVPAKSVLAALIKMYNLIGVDTEQLDALFFSPHKAMFPTSDFYFLARAAGKLSVKLGNISNIHECSVEMSDGASIVADVIVKCTGFTHDGSFDTAIGADAKKGGRVGNFHYSDSTSTQSRNSYFNGGTGGFRHISPSYSFMAQVEGLPHCVLAASNNLLRANVVNRVRSRQPLADFLLEQAREWASYCKMFEIDVDYPYTLEDMQIWDASLDGSKLLLDRRAGESEPFDFLKIQ